MGWEIHPSSLAEVLTRLHRDYGVSSLYVTENGAAFDAAADRRHFRSCRCRTASPRSVT